MKYEIIATGSKGNAVIINDEILIDCGVAYKKLELYVKKLKLVLLTHAHGDHFKPSTVRVLHRERPALRFGCCEWMIGPLLNAGVDKRMIDPYEPELPYIYGSNIGKLDGSFAVRASALPHDAQNCAYHIFLFGKRGEAESILYATDTGTLDGIEAKNYDLYLIEANHTQAEIEARAAEKLERGEFSYERRAAANHLSYEQTMDFLARNAGPNSKYVLLHRHKEEQHGNR